MLKNILKKISGKLIAFALYVTNQKKTKELIKVSYERLRNAEIICKTGYWYWNVKTGKVTWSEGTYLIFGERTENFKETYEDFITRVHPEDIERVQKTVQQIFDNKEPATYDFWIKTPAGEKKYITTNAAVILDDKGDVTSVSGHIIDITERKLGDAKLEASEKKLRQVLSSSTDNFYVIDRDYNVILINEMAEMNLEKAWGKQVKAGTNILDVVPDNGEEPIKESFEKAFSGESIEYELPLLQYDLPAWVLVNFTPVRDEEGIVTSVYVVAKDISDRKKAEQQVRNSEETRRLIMNAALDAIVGMDTKGVITIWTPQAEKIFGWDEKEVMGKVLADTIIPLQYRERHKKGMEHYLKTGAGPVLNKMIEITALNRLGKEFPIELSILPIKQGEAEFFCAFIRDITERKITEEAIKLSEEKYRSLVEQAVDAIALYDGKGKILDVNKGAVTLLGYTSDELKTMSVNQILTEEELAVDPVRYDVLQGGASTVKQRMMQKKDGSKVQTEVRSQQLPDGRFLSVIRDLTERLEAQQQIEKEKKLSDFIISSLPGVFFFFDHTGKFLRWNKEFEEVTGYAAEEIRHMHPFDFFEDDAQVYIANQFAKAFEKGERDAEADLKTKSGEKLTYCFTGVSINNDGVLCLVGTGMDISDRKKAEKELETSYSAIRRLTAHLQNIREEERTHIAREIHDELGQQLTVLKMDASWLYKKIGLVAENPVKEKINGLIEMLDRTVKTVRRISSDLRPSLLDDLGLVAAMEWQLEEFKKRSGIKTRFTNPGENTLIPDDVKTGLFRIFQESLTNVARHAEAKTIDVDLQSGDNNYVLRITDDGRGFDKQKIADKKTLGLLGMKERAAMMGGTYDIISTPRKGTTIRVTVPFSN